MNTETTLLNDPGQRPKDVQRILGCRPTKFWDLIKKGELDAYYVGRDIRVPLSSIQRYRETHAKVPNQAA